MNFLQKQRYIREKKPELLSNMDASRVWIELRDVLYSGIGSSYQKTPGVILGDYPGGN